jgi:hypothetical protein
MNRAEIIKLMREACDKDKVDAWANGFWTITQDEIERFAALVAAKEREECAKVVEIFDRTFQTGGGIAGYIRARGEK